jgi:glycosyltransferase involved in cell wall biosynthesis
MSRLRILVLAPDCNPESLANNLMGYQHAEALARYHDVTVVFYASNEEAIRRAPAPFHLEPVRLPWIDALYEWALRRIFKYDYGRQSLTAFVYPRHIAFELRAWRQVRKRVLSGEFDVVLRILPYVSVLPSPFALFLRKGPIPFVIGPVGGGLPWAKGFRQLEKQQQSPGYWIWSLRDMARHVPFARSTYANAAAIIASSSHTYSEFAKHREKLFFVPTEIGVDLARFKELQRARPSRGGKLELIFVGRLIPLKACDIALRGAAQLLRSGAAHFTVVGDGPERESLQQLTKSLGIADAVSFVGWIPQPETLRRLQNADVMVFPSLREIGGGVVFEALALGTVPVVADFGGPGDVVNPQIGYKIPMSNEDDMVLNIESVLTNLAEDRNQLQNLSERGMAYVREHLTWDKRVRVMNDILLWATGRGPKPMLLPPDRATPFVGRKNLRNAESAEAITSHMIQG